MAILSNQEIDHLLSCPKQVTVPPKKEMKVVNKSFRNEFELTSVDGAHSFSVFLRMNCRFPENFSIGLDYHSPEGGKITLLRCNGDHGPHQNHVIDNAFISGGPHVHMATEEALEAEFDPDDYAVPATDYMAYEEALIHFLERVNVVDASKCFSGMMRQISFINDLGIGT